MSDSIHEYVVAQLQAQKGHWPAIAEASGVPKRTLEKIASGETADPRVKTVEMLATYFRRRRAPS
jgi:transcriptional regulator with XRE-family HTH domain